MNSAIPAVLIGVTVAFFGLQSKYLWGDSPTNSTDPIAAIMSKPTMQILVSLAILGCALYIVLSHSYAEQEKHWAYGVIGAILGYWLKSK